MKPSEAPKKMAAMFNLGGSCVEPAVFSIQPKDDNIIAAD
jgi:hypothetical protein